MKALIMGGGMAGLATAINLLDQGIDVEIVEGDEIFGGRANSWLDEDGDMIDNALHVFFPYYVNLMAFFKKMGIENNLVWKQPEFYFAQDNGNQPVLGFKDLPAPLHAAVATLGMLKKYQGIPKWKLFMAMIPFASLVTKTKEQADKLDDWSWEEWCTRYAPKDAFKFLKPAANGLTFTEPYALSAKVMCNWFSKILGGYEYARLAFANGGLGEIWVGSCLDYIKKKGGTFEAKKAVTAIHVDNGKISEVIINGKEKRTADIYVSAMSPYALRKLVPAESMEFSYFQDVCYFENSPSMSIQIWFDKKLTDVDVTFFSNDCIFNTYADLSNVLPHIFKGGSMFEMVIAPADAVQHMSDQVIYNKVIADLKRLFPEARDAKVKKYKVVRERQGVYRPLPGMEKHRPYQRSPYGNFYLTGDWTKTHVSSGGMEAAIWTANHCAEVIFEDKLKKKIQLNIEFNPSPGLMPLIKAIKPAALIALAIAGLKIFKKFIGTR